MTGNHRQKNERGAIIIEASIALPVFIFAMYIILSITNICYVQAKVSIALDSAAQDISQYSYLYYRLGLDNLQSELHNQEGVADSRERVQGTISGVGALMDSMNGLAETVDMDAMTVDFEAMQGALGDARDAGGALTDNMKSYADAMADDPKGFIMGMGLMAADELSGEANALLARAMGRAFVKRNLKSFAADDADSFLKHYRVKDGLDGLDFSGSLMMTYGVSNTIQLVCTYEVEVVKLMNFDYSVRFRQCAKTSAWGNGVSKITPEVSTTTKSESVWNRSALNRGQLIVSYEKKNFPYVDTKHGFDAYNNKNGANEFVTITSKDTHVDSNSTAEKLKNALVTEANNMVSAVSSKGSDIEVTNSKTGEKETISSDPATRTYRIVLVVPEDADDTMVNDAVQKFYAAQAGTGKTFVVDVKKAYGSPTPKDES